MAAIEAGELLDVLAHPNPERYPGQRILVVRLDDYAHLVPFVETADGLLLKAIIPSRSNPSLLCGIRRTPNSCSRGWQRSGRTNREAAPARPRCNAPLPSCAGPVRSSGWARNGIPPQNLATYVGRSRTPQAITTPLQVEEILALMDALPDPRWRFGFQLMAAYGLRPEELHHLQLRDGRLWCTYEEAAAGPVMTGLPSGNSPSSTPPTGFHPCEWASQETTSGSICTDALSETSSVRTTRPRERNSFLTPAVTATPTGRT